MVPVSARDSVAAAAALPAVVSAGTAPLVSVRSRGDTFPASPDCAGVTGGDGDGASGDAVGVGDGVRVGDGVSVAVGDRVSVT